MTAMLASLPQMRPVRQSPFMTKGRDIDPERLLLGRAIAHLREARNLTQADAADRADPPMSPQYWGMHETGKVEGIYKPANQRKLLLAIGATEDDLQEAMLAVADHGPAHRQSRLRAIAGGLSEPSQRRAPAADSVRQAIFPTSDGEVTLTYPANLSPKAARELADYLTLFLRTAGHEVELERP